MVLRAADSYKTIDRLNVGGPRRRLIPDCVYEQAVIELSKGDELVIFTDGVSEAMNRDFEEWGEERLADTIRSATNASAPDLISRIMGRRGRLRRRRPAA